MSHGFEDCVDGIVVRLTGLRGGLLTKAVQALFIFEKGLTLAPRNDQLLRPDVFLKPGMGA